MYHKDYISQLAPAQAFAGPSASGKLKWESLLFIYLTCTSMYKTYTQTYVCVQQVFFQMIEFNWLAEGSNKCQDQEKGWDRGACGKGRDEQNTRSSGNSTLLN